MRGADIPRLRIGVYATAVTTPLYFRQAVGRFVRRRITEPIGTPAWVYLPADPVLQRYARVLEAAQRRALPTLQNATSTQPTLSSRLAAPAPSSLIPLGGAAWTQADISPITQPIQPPGTPPTATIPLFVQREQLRAQHQRLVSLIARRFGLAHRYVHTELMRRTGSRLEDADLAQLQARITLLRKWLREGL